MLTPAVAPAAQAADERESLESRVLKCIAWPHDVTSGGDAPGERCVCVCVCVCVWGGVCGGGGGVVEVMGWRRGARWHAARRSILRPYPPSIAQFCYVCCMVSCCVTGTHNSKVP